MVKDEIVRFNDDRYITTEKFNINELVKDDMYVIKLFNECSAQMEAERRKIEAYQKKY